MVQGRDGNTTNQRQRGIAGVDNISELLDALTPPKASGTRRFAQSKKGGTVEAVDAAMDRLIGKLIPELQRHLDTLVGLNLGPEGNADFARAITRLLRRLGPWALECPHCQGPAVLRYLPASKPGITVFRYEHSRKQRHGGSQSAGPLRLIRLDEKAPLD